MFGAAGWAIIVAVSDDDSKTPLEHTLDVFVYLPVGFVLDFPRSVPRYIERGRKLLDPSKLLSRTASPGGSGGPLGRLQDQTQATLRALGVTPPTSPEADAGHAGGNGSSPAPAAPDTAPTAPAAPAAAERVPVTPSHDPSELAITDYDSLSASQVVPRLDSLGDDELETVRQYEASTRARKTILNKIAQIQSA